MIKLPAVKVRDDGRIERLVAISYFLSTKTEIHIDELCERLNIDRTQLESDLNVLMFCGLPPYSPEQLFDIMIEDDFVSMYFNDVFISPLRLSEEEVAHVMIALSKLKSQSDSAEEINAISEVVSLIDNTASDLVVIESSESAFEKDIRQAINENLVLDLTYLSLNSASITQRYIEPKVVYATASISYVFGFDHSSKSYRVFRSDRILSASINKDIRVISNEEDFKEQAQIENDSTRVFIEQKDSYVDLKIDRQASWILDSYPHEEVDSINEIYRFYTPTPFFSARLIVSNLPFVSYVGGSHSRAAILGALERIEDQMISTSKNEL